MKINENSQKRPSIGRRKAANLIMGVAALGLMLGKKPVEAKDLAKELTVKHKEIVLTEDENSAFEKLSADEQALFLKLSARERSNFVKGERNWTPTERSNFFKFQRKE